MYDADAPSGQIIGLFAGKIDSRWMGEAPSAISKSALIGPVRVNEDGVEGDEQADLEAHGGVDQAIHHYAADHMQFWKEELPERASKFKPGCFGENVATMGLDEHNLCIGDVLTMGSAKVQVTQGRQPCWKLNTHLDSPRMAHALKSTAKTGWYYRVLEPGWVSVNDFISVTARPTPDWPIVAVIKARFDPALDLAVARTLSNIPHLSDDWRHFFAKKS